MEMSIAEMRNKWGIVYFHLIPILEDEMKLQRLSGKYDKNPWYEITIDQYYSLENRFKGVSPYYMMSFLGTGSTKFTRLVNLIYPDKPKPWRFCELEKRELKKVLEREKIWQDGKHNKELVFNHKTITEMNTAFGMSIQKIFDITGIPSVRVRQILKEAKLAESQRPRKKYNMGEEFNDRLPVGYVADRAIFKPEHTYFTFAEASKRYGIEATILYSLCYSGKIDYAKEAKTGIWKIEAKSLDTFLKNNDIKKYGGVYAAARKRQKRM